MLYDVVVTRPFDKVFTYSSTNEQLEIGQVVLVPFGKKIEAGIIWKKKVKNPGYEIKEVTKICNDLILQNSSIDFIYWIASYTLAPLGSVLKLFLINNDIVEFDKEKLDSFNNTEPSLVTLSEEQANSFKEITQSFNKSNKPVLLEGVTGSGKTEVYFEIIDKFLKEKKQILIMVPEISLTSQLETRVKKRFGMEVFLWHSKITKKNRQIIWHKCFAGDPVIVIGARSSLFLPFTNLGLIVVDEEHDSSYKQEDNIRYQARDLAVVRAKIEKNFILLASATPSLETINNVKIKKYDQVYLSKQFSGTPLPEISIIDLNKNKLDKDKWISQSIIDSISQCLDNKEQTLIFLNRRGYSPLTLCNSCGFRYECDQCSSWMVMHQRKKVFLCHQCGTIKKLNLDCPQCNEKNSIKFVGPGVERVAEELKEFFPGKNISIMSSDNVNTPNKIKKFITDINNKDIDIIVATQIMAKGYDFPNLSLVGIVDADAGLFGGDPRAIEKTFNLLQQVGGRAGRGKKIGKVFLQTYFPDQEIIKSIQFREREAFIERALEERKNFKIPPFGFMTSIILSSHTKALVLKHASRLAQQDQNIENIKILGPVEAPISLLRGQYRYRILLKSNSRKNLNKFTKKIVEKTKLPSSVKIIIDVDPYSFM
ncbi:primosomal protein N' [Pelagibacteraceae bacterium]|nr:primosomal protein N' [Pelagibacteraceae bacterium]